MSDFTRNPGGLETYATAPPALWTMGLHDIETDALLASVTVESPNVIAASEAAMEAVASRPWGEGEWYMTIAMRL